MLSVAVARPLRSRRHLPAAVWLAAAVVAAAMAIPLVYLVIRAAQADADAWNDLFRGATLHLFLRTAALAAAVTAASLALALPIAWLTARTDLPGRRLWTVLTVVPLVVPSYVGALAFVAAFGSRGTLQGLLEPFGVQSLPDVYGFTGALLALTLFTYPYLVMVLRAGLRGLDPACEEASRGLGFGPWRTFARTVVPQLRVPIAAGALLVALYVVSDFGAVSILRYDTFTRSIYTQYQSTFDRGAAAVLALALVGFVLLILALEARSRTRARYHRTGSGAARPPARIRSAAGAGPRSCSWRWWSWWRSGRRWACSCTGWFAGFSKASRSRVRGPPPPTPP